MRLKKLEITGFKSFHEKTAIEFPRGISAIVGPNGCGKSNIVDAIRWVMGEQSVKQLRGKAMEDVIFSGTKGASPQNMAEVSLTISNDNGSLPDEFKEYSEIMITRRLFRSGERYYFINKQPCRLKDIHSIFFGSGFGTRSYAVIQQGNIGKITEAGPEEIRFFVEEAAGTTRYKARKTEALRKIEATNQNLLRIKDIISEVQKQMSGLKRQAKKAKRFNEYQKNIRRLDIILSLRYHDDYAQKTDKTCSLLSELKNIDLKHTVKLKQLDSAIEQIKTDSLQKSEKISEQRSEIFETKRSIDKKENDLAHFRKDIKRLTLEIDEFKTARDELEEKNKNIIIEIEQIINRNREKKEEIKKLSALLDRKKSASQKVKEQFAALNETIEGYKSDLLDLTAKEARYKNIYQNAENNKENIKRRLKRIDEEEAIAKRDVKNAEKRDKRAKEQSVLLNAEKNRLKREIERISKDLEKNQKLLAAQVKQVRADEIELSKARSEYKALKKMEDNFEWYKEGVRAIMKARDFSSEIIGLLADVIEPEPSYETAVEAALGESLQYILVKDLDAGVSFVEYLQEKKAGRSGFIPVSSVKTVLFRQEANTDTQKKLINHIRVKPTFEKTAKALLDHVIVADNIKEAAEIANKNSIHHTIVTKQGDLISWQGFINGGSSDNFSGILTKKNRLKEVEKLIKQIEEKQDAEKLYQKELEAKVRAIETGLQKNVQKKTMTEQNLIEAEKAQYKAAEDLKHAKSHLEIISLKQEQLLGEQIDIDEEIARHNNLLSEIEISVKAAQNNVDKAKEKIESISAEMNKYSQQIIDINLKLTSKNAELENSEHTLRRLEDFQNDGLKRLKEIRQNIAQKNQSRIDLEQKIVVFQKTLYSEFERLSLIEHELKKNESAHKSLNESLKEHDGIVSNIQGKREEIMKKIRTLEIELSQNKTNKQNIENRLKELYHKELYELRKDFSGDLSDLKMPTEEIEKKLVDLRVKTDKIKEVNLGAIKEYEEQQKRLGFLCGQHDDLVAALDDLQKVVKKINRITQDRFIKTFEAINEKLNHIFPKLFGGGEAKLLLTDPDKPLETGVEFMIHPPGKKLTRISLLSGGEKALSAIALIFSIFLIKPASFCLMDEIDAALDDSNVLRFNELLKIIGEKSQILMVSHNKNSIKFADTLFGITMEKKGISKIVSVNFE